MNAWPTAFEKHETRNQAASSLNQPEIIGSYCVVNANQTTLRDLVDAEVRRQIADRRNDLITIAIKETFMDAVELATDYMDYHGNSTLYGLIEKLISRMIKTGQLDLYLEALLSNHAN